MPRFRRLSISIRRRRSSSRCAEPRWRSISTGAIQPNVMTLSTGKSTRAVDPRPRRLRIEAAAPLIGRGSTFAIRAEAVRQREASRRAQIRIAPYSLLLHRRTGCGKMIAARSVAQLVEHRSPKPGAGGSSPSSPATLGDAGVFFSREDLCGADCHILLGDRACYPI